MLLRLKSTAEASALTGLSEYELRLGAHQGRYPVHLIGTGKHRRMKWDLSLLEKVIHRDVIRRMKQLQTQEEKIKMLDQFDWNSDPLF